jgi:outer membrane protein
MEKILALSLVLVCGAASAQTPASNPMPDGSRDMYVGLGAVSTPRYEGGRERRVDAQPVLQVQFSNGMFISGMTAGLHLSADPALEFGPLLAIAPRRDESGIGDSVGGVEMSSPSAIAPSVRPPLLDKTDSVRRNRLLGLDSIPARLTAGAFVNIYLTPQLRLANSVLYGSGLDHNGVQWRADLQSLAATPSPRHAFSLSAGLTIANRHHVQSFFGVSPEQSLRSGNPVYAASGGVKDVHLGARWNWAVSPSWLLTAGAQATRLTGSAKDSPLVERPTNLTVTTALAWRF